MFNIPRRKREDEESGGEKKRMTFVQFRYDLLTLLSSRMLLEKFKDVARKQDDVT